MTTVETRHGAVRGQVMDGYTAWRGIPYAAPPVDDLRFRPPQPCPSWSGVREVSLWGSCAPQVAEGLASLGAMAGGTPGSSEDCLFLNVTAPGSGEGLPVLVWFHGGGYAAGWGAAHVGDVEVYARRGIVCVTVNYRLNALGFLDLAELLGEGYASSGSVGILDQISALKWVRRNIEAFGGDPARVTVAGVSAGAKSVATLMASPLARGLFAGAVSQSGGGDHVATPEVGAAVTRLLLDALGSSDPRTLLTLDAQVLAQTASTLLGPVHRSTWLWRPTVDGSAVVDVPTRAVAAGSAAGVALLAGSNTREAALFGLLDPAGPARAREVLTAGLGAPAAEQLWQDHRSRRTDDPDTDVAIMTAERYGIPTLRLLDAQAEHAPTYRYLFDGLAPGSPAALRGAHGSEVSFVFGIGAGSPLASRMQDAWAAFVTTGDPGWPGYDTGTRTTVVLGDEVAVVDDPDDEDRRAWGAATWTSGTWHPVPTATGRG